MECLVLKVGVVYVGIACLSRHLKEELAWALDKWLGFNVLKQVYHKGSKE